MKGKKVDTISYASCASCPYSGSIIDGYCDCPDAYTEQSKHCNIRKEMGKMSDLQKDNVNHKEHRKERRKQNEGHFTK